jgi:hypothetical protein
MSKPRDNRPWPPVVCVVLSLSPRSCRIFEFAELPGSKGGRVFRLKPLVSRQGRVKGDVTLSLAGRLKCTCSAFAKRHGCAHVETVLDMEAAGNVGVEELARRIVGWDEGD